MCLQVSIDWSVKSSGGFISMVGHSASDGQVRFSDIFFVADFAF